MTTKSKEARWSNRIKDLQDMDQVMEVSLSRAWTFPKEPHWVAELPHAFP